MSKLIIEFQHNDVMQPRPWPVGVNDEDIVTSGLGPDDGAKLLGFGTQGEQSVSVWVEDARRDPASVVGLVPTFSSPGGGFFEWQHVVGELTVIDEERPYVTGDGTRITRAQYLRVPPAERKASIMYLPEVKGIQTPEELAKLAADLRVRPDWHEPDEQEVGVRIRGNHLDNAMGSTMRDIGPDNASGEYNIVITRAGEDVAVVNLATLLSWAASIPARA